MLQKKQKEIDGYLIKMNNKYLACTICKTPLKKINNKIYFKCMCDEDIRIIPLNEIDSDNNKYKLYLFSVETLKN
jgi:hypothetical protein